MLRSLCLNVLYHVLKVSAIVFTHFFYFLSILFSSVMLLIFVKFSRSRITPLFFSPGAVVNNIPRFATFSIMIRLPTGQNIRLLLYTSPDFPVCASFIVPALTSLRFVYRRMFITSAHFSSLIIFVFLLYPVQSSTACCFKKMP